MAGEGVTPPQVEAEAPKKRRNRAAEEKERLRAQLAAIVDKVPQKVNAGSVQTTRQWVDTNDKARRTAVRARVSRRVLREALASMEAWRA